METTGVRDAAAKDLLVGYGSMDGLVKLDPPRSKKSRFAIIVVDSMEDTTIQMQAAEYIEHDESTEAIECFKPLRVLGKNVKYQLDILQLDILQLANYMLILWKSRAKLVNAAEC